jgi:cellulase
MRCSATLTLTALGCLAGGVLGHGQVQNFTTNGVYNQGFIRMSLFIFLLLDS